MCAHFSFVFGTVVDERVQEEQTVAKQFQKEFIVRRKAFNLQQKVAIPFDDVHDFFFEVDVVEDDLSFDVDGGL